MEYFKRYLNIYGDASRNTLYISTFLWLGLLAVVWLFNPITAIPSPSDIYTSFFALLYADGSSSLLYNVWVTLELQVFGIFYSVIISALISYVGKMAVFSPFNKFVQVLRYIPIVGFTLIFYSFFSIGFGMKVAMLTAGLTFFLTTSMTAVLNSIPKLKYELAKSLGYSDWEVFTSVVFIPSLPSMLEVIMQNAAMGWLMVVAVETFNRTEGGMGAMLQIYSASNQTANVYTYLFIIGIIAFIEDALFKGIKSFAFPYTQIAERA